MVDESIPVQMKCHECAELEAGAQPTKNCP